MSTKPTNLDDDIQRLINEGYSVSIENNCLIIRDIPYLGESQTVFEDGILVDTYPKTDHTFRFSAVPFTADGKELLSPSKIDGWNGFPAKTHLSFKKSDGKSQIDYTDHYDKVTYYINVIESHVRNVKPDVSARKYRPVDTSGIPDTPFQYNDLNSSRAGINHLSSKFQNQKVAIIGLGGTGSYLLDLIAKCPVAEIHLYDDDTFHTHNAFRAPGAASKGDIDNATLKVEYFYSIYANMHKYIHIHKYQVTSAVVEQEFSEYDFVFVCIDANEHKRDILLKLIRINIPFIDCGIAVDEIDSALNGTIRLTTVTAEKKDHLDQRIHCESAVNKDDIYSQNIQIAELNALNATLAVIKWKRIIGFYHNHESEHHSTYMFNCNSLSNDEKV